MGRLLMSTDKSHLQPQSIPISAARQIAIQYGYDQVIIFARKVGEEHEPNGEHMTTYGITKQHCEVAARMGQVLRKFMGWPED